MNNINILKLIILLSSTLFVSCNHGSEQYNDTDPIKGESIYIDSYNYDIDEFDNTDSTSKDGYSLRYITHKAFAFSELYKLYTPNGNLRLVASMGSEELLIKGYRIDYEMDGSVSCVSYLGYLEEEKLYPSSSESYDISLFNNWLKQSQIDDNAVRYVVQRDENKKIRQIGSVFVPSGYNAKYYLSPWGPFWSSDLDGGIISFFVLLDKEKKDGSYVNYLYCNNKLIAELAYWNGTFIKARTYNYLGGLVDKYTDRDIDVENQAFYDYYVIPQWYIE